MPQLASDNFQRANENPLSDGGNWTKIPGIFESPNQIVSNLCEGTQTNSCGNFYSGITWPNDQYSEFTLATLTTGSLGPVARCSSSAETYYRLQLAASGGSQAVGINLMNAGSSSTLGTSSNFSTAVGGILKIQAQGTTISAWYNGAQKLSVTDSTLSSGSAGIYLQPFLSNNSCQISAWDGGSVVTQQAAPTFSPVAGTYTTAQSVTLTSPGADAIYYTLDGSMPTVSSTLYTGPIAVSRTTTINAIAVKSGFLNSTVATAVYTITLAFTFNSAFRLTNFPTTGQPGTLWFDTETTDLYVAVAFPNEYFPGESDGQNVTRIFSEGLTVSTCTRLNVPALAAAGTIFLTTDTFEAFAGTGFPGPGNGVIEFNLDVHRALRGIGLPQQDLSGRVPIGAPATPVFYVSLG
jgi:hypothetical protein